MKKFFKRLFTKSDTADQTPMRIDKISSNLSKISSDLDKLSRRLDWQAKISKEAERLSELKKQTLQVQNKRDTTHYANLSGYYSAIIPLLAAMEPADAFEYVKRSADELEQNLPFEVLRHSEGTKL